MEVARAAWGLRCKICSPSLAPLRLASTAARQTAGKPKARPTIRRFVPEDVKRFVKADGKLLTTRENKEFLLNYDIEPDNGRMTRFAAGPDLGKLASDYNVTFAFSPKHVVHPHDLRYFEPRGHPLAAMKRAEYARNTREKPLWIMVTSAGGASAVVRTLTQRRLARAIHKALEAMGYRSGLSPTKEIRGTFWATIHNPIKAATHSAERFGKAVAAALDKNCSRGRR
ncbi:3-isopropylmalate dehydrogenase [Purpureocillium lavendulum]|uniref:3-isopropylmalate dehydrogenase n=1 Tax=Purpureocillium lavendulum TaxID=1247861 RepID=A0AB34G095_9HYPO|nr:3-isopropylmalate dehydrogenase [Purpureocillium lavendulum]